MKLHELYNDELIRQRTREARDGDKGEFTDKAREVAAIIDASDFGCQTENVRKLVSAILGINIPTERSEEFVLGTVVEYQDKTQLVSSIDDDGDARLVDHKGRLSDYVGARDDWSYSSDERIDRFIRKAFGDAE